MFVGPATSSLFRGLTPDWGKLTSLSPSEWQQLLQLTEQPVGGAWDVAGPAATTQPPTTEHQSLSRHGPPEVDAPIKHRNTRIQERHGVADVKEGATIDKNEDPLNIYIGKPPVVTVTNSVAMEKVESADVAALVYASYGNGKDSYMGDGSAIAGIGDEGERAAKRRCVAGSGFGL